MRDGEIVSGPLTDLSGTVTTGGTAQTVSAAKPRRYLLIQNISAEDLWVNFGVAAVADSPSVLIPGALDAGLVFEAGFIPDGYLSVIGATTGNKFVIKEAV